MNLMQACYEAYCLSLEHFITSRYNEVAFKATSNAAFTAICAGNHPFAAAYDPLHFPLMFPHGDTGWHLQMPQVQNPTPNPDLMRAQQQQLEDFSALQHEMQAE